VAQDSGISITRERIAAVEQTIRPHIRRTPVVELDGSDFGLRPFPLTLKRELLQHSRPGGPLPTCCCDRFREAGWWPPRAGITGRRWHSPR
jgi:hypothetical protein